MPINRKALIGAALVFGIIVLAAAQAPPEDPLLDKARRFLDFLSRGDYVAAARDFDGTMMRVIPPAKLEEFWRELPGKLSPFKRMTGAARKEKLAPYEIVLLTCEFEKTTLDCRVVFDKEGKIAGFQFVPSLPPAEYKAPDYADSALFSEKEVVVGSPEWPLPGLLTVPKGSGPFPALVLVHGSGPNDKDETLGPNKPFKDLAWGLASRGVAVLRYDKRTKVFGPKFAADPVLTASLTVREETVDDALAAAALLRKTEGIDPKRIFILGHSLGGYLIPRIAEAGRGLEIAGYVVLAGLTRTLEDTMLQQMTYLFGLDGQLSDDDKAKLAEIRAQVDKIKTLSEHDIESGNRLLNAYPKYWLDLRAYDPPQAARSIAQPLLILQGSRDYQVTTEDFENWRKALGSKPNAMFKLYPRLNHLFFAGQGLPNPGEYMQIHGSLDREVVEDIAAWVKGH